MTIHRFPISSVVCAIFFILAGSARAESLKMIVQYGQPAPGNLGNFRVFGIGSGYSPAIDGHNIAFGAAVDGGGGIYAVLDGELIMIADTLTPFPDRDENIGGALFYGSGPSISGRNIAFYARSLVEGTSVFAYINGQLRRIVDRSTPVPGGIGTFNNFAALDGAQPAISGENVAFTAFSDEGGGIYAYINGQLRVIADTHTPVPDGVGNFTNFGNLNGNYPAISGENVAFVGMWNDGTFRRGLYAYINNKLRMIKDRSVVTLNGNSPSISGENIAYLASGKVYAYINGENKVIAEYNKDAPGGGTFRLFGENYGNSPTISGENVVFQGWSTGIGVGFWAYIDGCLKLIAGEPSAVPGYGVTFSRFGINSGASADISGEDIVFSGAWSAEGHFRSGLFLYTQTTPPTVLRDIAGLQHCFTGTSTKILDDCCTQYDLNHDNFIDLTDFTTFMSTTTTP